VMPTRQALERARELDLDLVEVAPQADPPVCRLMDFGKWKYEQDVRAKEARKRQSQVVVKEMKFRPKISSHDYEVKRNHVRRFLEEGSKVKITIMFRGREMAHTELGAKLLDRLAKDLSDVANVELIPKLDGRNMTMVLAPIKRPDKPEKAEKAERKPPAGTDQGSPPPASPDGGGRPQANAPRPAPERRAPVPVNAEATRS
jgi:translation initiation factor IF-3